MIDFVILMAGVAFPEVKFEARAIKHSKEFSLSVSIIQDSSLLTKILMNAYSCILHSFW